MIIPKNKTSYISVKQRYFEENKGGEGLDKRRLYSQSHKETSVLYIDGSESGKCLCPAVLWTDRTQ